MTFRFWPIIFVFCLSLSLAEAAVKHDPFVVVTPPQSGTRLLTNTMEKLTGKRCQNLSYVKVMNFEEWQTRLRKAEKSKSFIHIHAYPRKEQIAILRKLGYKVLFLMRDPRDQAVSLLFYLDQSIRPLGPLSMESEPYQSLSFDDKLHEIITGDRTGFCALKEIFIKYLPWMHQEHHFVHVTHFEHLVGKDGGGTRDQQMASIRGIMKFLHMKISGQQIAECTQDLFTYCYEQPFHQAGLWRQYFKFTQKYVMQQQFGKEMEKLHYTYDSPPDPAAQKKRLAAERLKKKKKESEIIVQVPKVK
ncbi:MAG: hypothetical protein LLG04_14700 [Parachlamydia sp.]|nr:hypothetical protein [Parachlamydia sp.]